MVKRRRRNNRSSRIWTWISFVVFSLLLILLGLSIYKKQTPRALIKSYLEGSNDGTSIERMSKKELRVLASQQETLIEDLKKELDECKTDDGFRKGRISTTSDALNMRSAPSIDSDVIMRIPNGSSISILFFDTTTLVLEGESGSWCKIKYADQEGWVWGNYVESL